MILEDCGKIVQSIRIEDSGLKKFMLDDIKGTRGYKGLQHQNAKWNENSCNISL